MRMVRGAGVVVFTSTTLTGASQIVVDDSYSLTVTSPVTGEMITAGEMYTVKFDYVNEYVNVDRFDIDLYTADGGTGDCGTWVASICDKDHIGCLDSMGDYNVEIPDDTPPGDYSIRVGRFEDKSLFGCSGNFRIVGRDGEDGEEEINYSLTVTSPVAGDVAMAGEEYTVKFDYVNEYVNVDRFDIDLYTADGGTGECGTWVASICDQPGFGCLDSTGDYDGKIPDDTPSGEYSIRVGRNEDPDLFDCSGTFRIVERND